VKERVQKLMAQADLGSRRECEELIRQGRVTVNGQVIELGMKADPAEDTIVVDGRTLHVEDQRKIYIALNKPINVLSTDEPHKNDPRRTVRDLLPVKGHLFMIGRLDADSAGLVVLTNDGDLANRLSHPRYRHTKTYRVTVYGLPNTKTLEQWERGIHLPDEGMTAPCSVRIKKADQGLTVLEIVMTEGKKRQIRRVAAALGYPVRHLTRTHIGQLSLGDLKPGEWRELNESEVKALRTADPAFRRIRPTRPGRYIRKRPHERN
jgi:pseudouridine synthase